MKTAYSKVVNAINIDEKISKIASIVKSQGEWNEFSAKNSNLYHNTYIMKLLTEHFICK